MLQLGDERQGWLNALIRLSAGWLGAAAREPNTGKMSGRFGFIRVMA
jgi:hypothetical protein